MLSEAQGKLMYKLYVNLNNRRYGKTTTFKLAKAKAKAKLRTKKHKEQLLQELKNSLEYDALLENYYLGDDFYKGY